MAAGQGLNQRIVPLFASLLVIAFYAVVSIAVPTLFPTTFAVGNIPEGVDFSSAYDSLLAWAGLSCCAIAIGLVMAGYAGRQLWQSHPSFPYSFAFASILSVASLWLLVRSGNAAVQTLQINLCREYPASALCASDALSLARGINTLKMALNGAFQVGATFLLVATLETSAHCARNASAKEVFRDGCALYDRLFLAASFLLTLIIFTDVLFLSFVRAVLPAGGELAAYQEGFVIYFAIVSSMVLGLTLAAATLMGHPLAIPDLARAHRDTLEADHAKAISGVFDSLAALVKAPTTSKAIAAFAPLLVGLLGPLIDLHPS